MSDLDPEVPLAVLGSYFRAGSDHLNGLRSARSAVELDDLGATVESLVLFDVALLGGLTGVGGTTETGTLLRISRMTQTLLLRGFELAAAVAVLTAYRSSRWDEEEGLRRAREVVAGSDLDVLFDELVSVGVALLALYQAEKGGTVEEALEMFGRLVRHVAEVSDKPFLGIRGPRSFAKFVADLVGSANGDTKSK